MKSRRSWIASVFLPGRVYSHLCDTLCSLLVPVQILLTADVEPSAFKDCGLETRIPPVQGNVQELYETHLY